MKYVILRRFTQLSLLSLFAMGNFYGLSFIQGDLGTSKIFQTLILSDPYAVLQMFFAGAVLSFEVFLGAFLLVLFYGFIGGRAFCSWVCPMNIISDLASFTRKKLGIKTSYLKPKRQLRYYIFALSLALSFLLGFASFEAISPIGAFSRSLIFGFGFGLNYALMIYLFDTFIMPFGWCGHICPLGAFWALIGRYGFVKIFHNKDKCTKCAKCLDACPEVQILNFIGKKSDFVKMPECTKCLACISSCEDQALKISFKIGEKNVEK